MTNNGGYAFPSETISDDHTGFNKGMSLRDYFAAKAMQGIISTINDARCPSFDHIARMSYDMADEMLKERIK